MNRQNILLAVSASLATVLVMLAIPAVGQLTQPAPAVSPAPASPDPAPQADRIVPASQMSMQQSFAPVVQRTAPAVVNVFSSVHIQRSNCQYAGTIWEPVYCRNAITRDEKVDNSLGSGVIVGSDGVIVTNNHVVARPPGLARDQAQEFRVALYDRREFPAKLVMTDPHSDLAVLKIDTKESLPTLDYADTRGVQVGDLVLAIGNPFGVGQSVTSGIVSALARTDVGISDTSSFIQTDASINPGNSGGALVDMKGRLVGINSMIFSSGGGSNGIGFAIPSEMVKRVVDAAVHGGTLVRPWLGAGGDPVTGQQAASLGLAAPKGVRVTSIFPGSPAEKAGLKTGDVILSVDGREVYDDKGIKFISSTKAEGETVNLSVLRGGQQKLMQAKLVAPPGAAKSDLVQVGGRNPLTGAQVRELSPAIANDWGLDPVKFQSGMLVYAMPPYSYASQLGFQPNDIIKEVNGVPTRTAKDLDTALNKADQERAWRIAFERDGQRFEKTF